MKAKIKSFFRDMYIAFYYLFTIKLIEFATKRVRTLITILTDRDPDVIVPPTPSPVEKFVPKSEISREDRFSGSFRPSFYNHKYEDMLIEEQPIEDQSNDDISVDDIEELYRKYKR